LVRASGIVVVFRNGSVQLLRMAMNIPVPAPAVIFVVVVHAWMGNPMAWLSSAIPPGALEQPSAIV
jgi:hypothetical protein